MILRIVLSAVFLSLAQPVVALDASAVAKAVVADWQAWMKKHGIREGAIIVAHDGVVMAETGIGRSVDDPAKIASLSKSITAICALKAADQAGKGAETPMSEAIPSALEEHPPKDARFAKITIGQLITHTSGLDTDYHRVELPKLKTFEKENKLWQFSKVAKETLSQDPGQAPYRYANANYLVLGLVIEELTGEGYEAYCQREVLAAAGATTGRLNQSWRVMSAWGGWEVSARDFLAFAQQSYRGPTGVERPGGYRLPPASLERGRLYGAGVLFRRTPLGDECLASWVVVMVQQPCEGPVRGLFCLV